MEQTFNEYIQEARDKFVNEINSQQWDTKLRCSAEDLLIAFDQMREKLKEKPVHSNNEDWGF